MSSLCAVHVLTSGSVTSGGLRDFAVPFSLLGYVLLLCFVTVCSPGHTISSPLVCHALVLIQYNWLFHCIHLMLVYLPFWEHLYVLCSVEILLNAPSQRSFPAGGNWDFHHCCGDIIPRYGYFPPIVYVAPEPAFLSALVSVEFPKQLFQLVLSVKALSLLLCRFSFVPQPGLWGWAGQLLGCAAPLCPSAAWWRRGAQGTGLPCAWKTNGRSRGQTGIGMWYQKHESWGVKVT